FAVLGHTPPVLAPCPVHRPGGRTDGTVIQIGETFIQQKLLPDLLPIAFVHPPIVACFGDRLQRLGKRRLYSIERKRRDCRASNDPIQTLTAGWIRRFGFFHHPPAASLAS